MSLHPSDFRATLIGIEPFERDAWLDRVFGFELIPEDGPSLAAGCVPYLPCSVDALLRMVEQADVQASDVFVDIGSGVGRSAALVHLVTGAKAIGIELQPELVRASRELIARLKINGFSVLEGDAAQLLGQLSTGSVFFLYCPFSGARLERLLDDLEPIARSNPLRICSVDLPLPPRPWLRLVSPEPERDLAVYRSTF